MRAASQDNNKKCLAGHKVFKLSETLATLIEAKSREHNTSPQQQIKGATHFHNAQIKRQTHKISFNNLTTKTEIHTYVLIVVSFFCG